MAHARNTMANASNELAPAYLDQAQGQMRLIFDVQPVNAAVEHLRALPVRIPESTLVQISVEHLRRARVLPINLVTPSAGPGLKTTHAKFLSFQCL